MSHPSTLWIASVVVVFAFLWIVSAQNVLMENDYFYNGYNVSKVFQVDFSQAKFRPDVYSPSSGFPFYNKPPYPGGSVVNDDSLCGGRVPYNDGFPTNLTFFYRSIPNEVPNPFFDINLTSHEDFFSLEATYSSPDIFGLDVGFAFFDVEDLFLTNPPLEPDVYISVRPRSTGIPLGKVANCSNCNEQVALLSPFIEARNLLQGEYTPEFDSSVPPGLALHSYVRVVYNGSKVPPSVPVLAGAVNFKIRFYTYKTVADICWVGNAPTVGFPVYQCSSVTTRALPLKYKSLVITLNHHRASSSCLTDFKMFSGRDESASLLLHEDFRKYSSTAQVDEKFLIGFGASYIEQKGLCLVHSSPQSENLLIPRYIERLVDRFDVIELSLSLSFDFSDGIDILIPFFRTAPADFMNDLMANSDAPSASVRMYMDMDGSTVNVRMNSRTSMNGGNEGTPYGTGDFQTLTYSYPFLPKYVEFNGPDRSNPNGSPMALHVKALFSRSSASLIISNPWNMDSGDVAVLEVSFTEDDHFDLLNSVGIFMSSKHGPGQYYCLTSLSVVGRKKKPEFSSHSLALAKSFNINLTAPYEQAQNYPTLKASPFNTPGARRTPVFNEVFFRYDTFFVTEDLPIREPPSYLPIQTDSFRLPTSPGSPTRHLTLSSYGIGCQGSFLSSVNVTDEICFFSTFSGSWVEGSYMKVKFDTNQQPFLHQYNDPTCSTLRSSILLQGCFQCTGVGPSETVRLDSCTYINSPGRIISSFAPICGLPGERQAGLVFKERLNFPVLTFEIVALLRLNLQSTTSGAFSPTLAGLNVFTEDSAMFGPIFFGISTENCQSFMRPQDCISLVAGFNGMHQTIPTTYFYTSPWTTDENGYVRVTLVIIFDQINYSVRLAVRDPISGKLEGSSFEIYLSSLSSFAGGPGHDATYVYTDFGLRVQSADNQNTGCITNAVVSTSGDQLDIEVTDIIYIKKDGTRIPASQAPGGLLVLDEDLPLIEFVGHNFGSFRNRRSSAPFAPSSTALLTFCFYNSSSCFPPDSNVTCIFDLAPNTCANVVVASQNYSISANFMQVSVYNGLGCNISSLSSQPPPFMQQCSSIGSSGQAGMILTKVSYVLLRVSSSQPYLSDAHQQLFFNAWVVSGQYSPFRRRALALDFVDHSFIVTNQNVVEHHYVARFPNASYFALSFDRPQTPSGRLMDIAVSRGAHGSSAAGRFGSLSMFGPYNEFPSAGGISASNFARISEFTIVSDLRPTKSSRKRVGDTFIDKDSLFFKGTNMTLVYVADFSPLQNSSNWINRNSLDLPVTDSPIAFFAISGIPPFSIFNSFICAGNEDSEDEYAFMNISPFDLTNPNHPTLSSNDNFALTFSTTFQSDDILAMQSSMIFLSDVISGPSSATPFMTVDIGSSYCTLFDQSMMTSTGKQVFLHPSISFWKEDNPCTGCGPDGRYYDSARMRNCSALNGVIEFTGPWNSANNFLNGDSIPAVFGIVELNVTFTPTSITASICWPEQTYLGMSFFSSQCSSMSVHRPSDFSIKSIGYKVKNLRDATQVCISEMSVATGIDESSDILLRDSFDSYTDGDDLSLLFQPMAGGSLLEMVNGSYCATGSSGPNLQGGGLILPTGIYRKLDDYDTLEISLEIKTNVEIFAVAMRALTNQPGPLLDAEVSGTPLGRAEFLMNRITAPPSRFYSVRVEADCGEFYPCSLYNAQSEPKDLVDFFNPNEDGITYVHVKAIMGRSKLSLLVSRPHNASSGDIMTAHSFFKTTNGFDTLNTFLLSLETTPMASNEYVCYDSMAITGTRMRSEYRLSPFPVLASVDAFVGAGEGSDPGPIFQSTTFWPSGPANQMVSFPSSSEEFPFRRIDFHRRVALSFTQDSCAGTEVLNIADVRLEKCYSFFVLGGVLSFIATASDTNVDQVVIKYFADPNCQTIRNEVSSTDDICTGSCVDYQSSMLGGGYPIILLTGNCNTATYQTTSVDAPVCSLVRPFIPSSFFITTPLKYPKAILQMNIHFPSWATGTLYVEESFIGFQGFLEHGSVSIGMTRPAFCSGFANCFRMTIRSTNQVFELYDFSLAGLLPTIDVEGNFRLPFVAEIDQVASTIRAGFFASNGAIRFARSVKLSELFPGSSEPLAFTYFGVVAQSGLLPLCFSDVSVQITNGAALMYPEIIDIRYRDESGQIISASNFGNKLYISPATTIEVVGRNFGPAYPILPAQVGFSFYLKTSEGSPKFRRLLLSPQPSFYDNQTSLWSFPYVTPSGSDMIPIYPAPDELSPRAILMIYTANLYGNPFPEDVELATGLFIQELDSFELFYTQDPDVTSICPSESPISTAVNITVFGIGFIDTPLLSCAIIFSTGGDVFFDAVYVSPTSVTCLIPDDIAVAGLHSLTVSSSGVSATGGRPFTFTTEAANIRFVTDSDGPISFESSTTVDGSAVVESVQGKNDDLYARIVVTDSLSNAVYYPPGATSPAFIITCLNCTTPEQVSAPTVGVLEVSTTTSISYWVVGPIEILSPLYGKTYLLQIQVTLLSIPRTLRPLPVRTLTCDELLPNSVLVSAGNCQCRPGHYYFEASDACLACPTGRYSDVISRAPTCSICPTNRITRLEGSTSIDDCLCDRGYFDLGTENRACGQCAAGQNCTVAGVLTPLPGFWRVDADESTMYPCFNPNACNGGLNSTCAEGYQGILCAVCQEGYGQLGNSCVKCPPQAGANFLLFLIFCLFIAIVVSLIRAATRPKSVSSIVLKIAVNYFQVLTFFYGYVSWPSSISGMYTTASTVTLSLNAIYFTCSTKYSYYERLVILFIFPILVIIGCSIVVPVIYMVRRFLGRSARIGSAYRLWGLSILVLLFLAHPGVCSQTFEIFNCRDIGPYSFLQTDPSIDCNSNKYKGYRNFAAFFVLYIFGLPLFALLMIYKNYKFGSMKQLYASRWAFLVTGYAEHAYFWEFVTLIRKILIVLFNVFLGSNEKLFAGVCLLVAAMQLNTAVQPFQEAVLYRLESLTLISLFVTLASGLAIGILHLTRSSLIFIQVLVIGINSTTLAALLFFYIKFFFDGAAKARETRRETEAISRASRSGTEMKDVVKRESQVKLAFTDDPQDLLPFGTSSVQSVSK